MEKYKRPLLQSFQVRPSIVFFTLSCPFTHGRIATPKSTAPTLLYSIPKACSRYAKGPIVIQSLRRDSRECGTNFFPQCVSLNKKQKIVRFLTTKIVFFQEKNSLGAVLLG
ncbi:uncharacterized protein LOC122501358 isoform X3 [Leptopilina heterotoma]|uniref:uncharacterized protein LOC122501358 isoform X3 n=1 Tax=Leptopilina heterotoma TaxID=63436 RepID=UPI001CA8E24B|nr:uncharacterized protein LOC122501358 isoform X3 [Leptopilina heterotoma]